ncbi:MAG: D-2-hydroxyacid dehydrogenase [Verrucomicrobia bacterium]|nr:D-2-hydroxyacid dehydrogenase [Verrucomicrobiota bacterium]MCH8512600.1 D-2-hydroxyacid dehydrogenase [Kiritimatiellia bacterium]
MPFSESTFSTSFSACKRIFVDFKLPAGALAALRAGTEGYALLFPETPADSVLQVGGADAGFASAEIVLGQPDPAAVLASEAVRWVQVTSSGITRYDTPEFRAGVAEKGVVVCNSAAVYAAACAEHALAFLLAQSRNLVPALQTVAFAEPADWLTHRNACVSLRGQTILIVGYGAIGRCLAAYLKPFGMRILAWRRNPEPEAWVTFLPDESALAEALGEADHVMNILPDSPATRHFFDDARLRQCRPGAVFYNIGRGATVDQEALGLALRENRLGAAWLDVTDPEPLPADHPLRREPRCWITPHVAGGHADEALSLVLHFLDNLRRAERGVPLINRVM